jgi:hypothetical protein
MKLPIMTFVCVYTGFSPLTTTILFIEVAPHTEISSIRRLSQNETDVSIYHFALWVAVTAPVERYIQKFSDWVDKEIYAYNNKHSLRTNAKVTAAKLTILTHKIAIQLHLLAESCTICSSRSRRPVRKLLDTPRTTLQRPGKVKTERKGGSDKWNCIIVSEDSCGPQSTDWYPQYDFTLLIGYLV